MTLHFFTLYVPVLAGLLILFGGLTVAQHLATKLIRRYRVRRYLARVLAGGDR